MSDFVRFEFNISSIFMAVFYVVRTHALQPVEVKSLWTIFLNFFHNMYAIVCGFEWIIRAGGELYHGEICNIH